MISLLLSIILTILKIIGIILLVLIGLLLFIVLSILLNSIRYSAKGNLNTVTGTYDVSGKITYLYHIISVVFNADNQNTDFKIKIFGFELKEKKERVKKRRRQKLSKEKNFDEEFFEDDDTDSVQKLVFGEKGGAEKTEQKKEDNTISLNEELDKLIPELMEQKHTSEDNEDNINNTAGSGDVKKTKHKFFSELSMKINNKKKRLTNGFSNIKQSFSGKSDDIRNKINKTTETRKKYMDYFTTVESRQALNELKARCFKVLKHIKPKKLNLMLEYNLTDPSWTGKAYAFLSVLFNGINDNLDIRPDFEESEKPYIISSFDGKGRIRLMVFLWHGFMLYRNKKIKEMYNFIKN